MSQATAAGFGPPFFLRRCMQYLGCDENFALDAAEPTAYPRPWATPPQRGAYYLEG